MGRSTQRSRPNLSPEPSFAVRVHTEERTLLRGRAATPRRLVLPAWHTCAIAFGGVLSSFVLRGLFLRAADNWYVLLPVSLAIPLMPLLGLMDRILDVDANHIIFVMHVGLLLLCLNFAAASIFVAHETVINWIELMLDDMHVWLPGYMLGSLGLGGAPGVSKGVRLLPLAGLVGSAAFTVGMGHVRFDEGATFADFFLRYIPHCVSAYLCGWSLAAGGLLGSKASRPPPPSPPWSPPEGEQASLGLPAGVLDALAASVTSSLKVQADTLPKAASWAQRFKDAHIVGLEAQNLELKVESATLKAESTVYKAEIERLAAKAEGQLCEGFCHPRTVLTNDVKVWRWTSGMDQLALCSRCYMDDTPGFWRSDENLDNTVCACGGVGRWRGEDGLLCDTCRAGDGASSSESGEGNTREDEVMAKALALAYGGSPDDVGPAWP